MKGGGGSSTQSSSYSGNENNQFYYKDWEKEYLPEGARQIWQKTWPIIAGNVGQGLTPAEKAQYVGTGTAGVNKVYSQAESELPEIMARSGISPNEGAGLQLKSSLYRDKVKSMADMLSGIIGTDTAKKEQNLTRAEQEVHQNYATPLSSSARQYSGNSTTTISQPDTSSSSFGDILSGMIGGGTAGYQLISSLGRGTSSPWAFAAPAAGALLGGLGKAFK